MRRTLPILFVAMALCVAVSGQCVRSSLHGSGGVQQGCQAGVDYATPASTAAAVSAETTRAQAAEASAVQKNGKGNAVANGMDTSASPYNGRTVDRYTGTESFTGALPANTILEGVGAAIPNSYIIDKPSAYPSGNAPQLRVGTPTTVTSNGVQQLKMVESWVARQPPIVTVLTPTGNTNDTFTPQATTLYMHVRGACSGGSGTGSGPRGSTGDGGTSSDSCNFGTWNFAQGGVTYANNLEGGFAGGATANAAWSSAGDSGQQAQITVSAYVNGSNGGSSCLGPGGRGGSALGGDAGSDPARQAQPGADGAGGGGGANKGGSGNYAGNGGGAGACVNGFYLVTRDSSGNPVPITWHLSYGVQGGPAGANGFPGGAGGNGKLIIEEYQ